MRQNFRKFFCPVNMADCPLADSNDITIDEGVMEAQGVQYTEVQLSGVRGDGTNRTAACYNCYNMSSIYVYIRLWLIE